MRPRELLEGEKLDGGWTVGKMIQKKGGTGSFFSVGYIVSDENGRECYLKAMDYHEAMTAKQQFLSPFHATYGHVPAPGAIFGYEAMSAILSVLREAGSQANNRKTVVRDFFAIKNRPSVVGTYSINSQGDTSISPFIVSRLVSGTLVPYKFVQANP